MELATRLQVQLHTPVQNQHSKDNIGKSDLEPKIIADNFFRQTESLIHSWRKLIHHNINLLIQEILKVKESEDCQKLIPLIVKLYVEVMKGGLLKQNEKMQEHLCILLKMQITELKNLSEEIIVWLNDIRRFQSSDKDQEQFFKAAGLFEKLVSVYTNKIGHDLYKCIDDEFTNIFKKLSNETLNQLICFFNTRFIIHVQHSARYCQINVELYISSTINRVVHFCHLNNISEDQREIEISQIFGLIYNAIDALYVALKMVCVSQDSFNIRRRIAMDIANDETNVNFRLYCYDLIKNKLPENLFRNQLVINKPLLHYMFAELLETGDAPLQHATVICQSYKLFLELYQDEDIVATQLKEHALKSIQAITLREVEAAFNEIINPFLNSKSNNSFPRSLMLLLTRLATGADKEDNKDNTVTANKVCSFS